MAHRARLFRDGRLGVAETELPANGCHLLGLVQRAQGRLDAAAGAYRLALPVAGIGYAGLAEVAYQRDELDAASPG